MAMGLPIITLDLHGAHDFVPDGASLKVSVTDPAETVRNIACAIERYASLSHPRRAQMSAVAWNFARTLSWPARVEMVERLYEEVVSRTTPLESVLGSNIAVEAT
jgi:glycosyltransferase involved in cell wall biosynthesis